MSTSVAPIHFLVFASRLPNCSEPCITFLRLDIGMNPALTRPHLPVNRNLDTMRARSAFAAGICSERNCAAASDSARSCRVARCNQYGLVSWRLASARCDNRSPNPYRRKTTRNDRRKCREGCELRSGCWCLERGSSVPKHSRNYKISFNPGT